MHNIDTERGLHKRPQNWSKRMDVIQTESDANQTTVQVYYEEKI